jgi:flagellar motor switch protein FliM
MNPESPTTESPEPHSFLDAEVTKAEEAELVLKASLSSFLDDTTPPSIVEGNTDPANLLGADPKGQGAQAYDFRNPILLSPAKLHRLEAHQEEFSQSVAARFSAHLRSEFTLKVTGVRTIGYQKLAQGWKGPAHLNLFKMEPLRGVSILEISYHLGMSMVDRLMGGSGNVSPTDQEISEIEKVLLEQSVQLFLDEWCAHWANVKGLKPSLLGYENFGGFIQTIPLETIMLVVSLQAEFAECKGQIQIGVPYAAVDPLIRRLCQAAEPAATSTSPASGPAQAPLKWNACFDDVQVPVTAEWDGLEMTARQILALKIGDVLPLAGRAHQVNVRVADMLKFQGRPGTQAGQWAVQLTRKINP